MSILKSLYHDVIINDDRLAGGLVHTTYMHIKDFLGISRFVCVLFLLVKFINIANWFWYSSMSFSPLKEDVLGFIYTLNLKGRGYGEF